MNKQHKHAELIKAWADGAEIEYFDNICHAWLTCQKAPTWAENNSYRIKPESKPDMVYYGQIDEPARGGFSLGSCFTREYAALDQVKLTFDGSTGKLKSVEMLND